MLMDWIITFLLFAITLTVETIGYAFLAICGYGWLWGPPLPYARIVRHPFSHRRMEGFYGGLVVTPVVVSLGVSLAYEQPLVIIVVGGSLAVLFIANYYFKKNFFVPLLGGAGVALVLTIACLMRLSVMLLFFFLYVFLAFLGPLLLAFFLASI